jgi:UDP-N-acetylmuramate--alanine ligase
MPSSKKVQKSAYFIGIGGIGMSAFARYLHAKGWRVAGSDGQKSSVTDELNKEGIRVKIGHDKAHFGLKMARRAAFSRIIYNRAIRTDNPEFMAASAAGIPLIPYAEALGEVTRDYETAIAITGSHGKSTTTALASVMLMHAKRDPTIFIGTKLAHLGGRNVRVGRGNYLVLEADDYGAAFLHYSPSVAIVTNIDREHMDFYKTFARVKRAFLAFLARTREGGTLILNWDDRPLRSLRTEVEKIATRRKLKVVWYSASAAVAKKVKKYITLPGAHNLSNGLAAYALGRHLGIPEAKILSALHSYRGAWRRMEYRGTIAVGSSKIKVKVFDDYAHHPAEIKATLAGFREKFPHAALLVAFQPHQAKRLEVLFKEFVAAFGAADATWIAPIYKVAGRDEPTKYDSAALVRAVSRRYPGSRIFYLEDLKLLRKAVGELLATPLFHGRKQAVLVMMGAGDIVETTEKILK